MTRPSFSARIAISALLLLSAAAVRADAPEPVSLAELIDAYQGTVREAAGATQARFEAMIATPQGKAYEAALAHQQDVQARLSKRLQDRTGKVIDWTTGALKDPPAAASQ